MIALLFRSGGWLFALLLAIVAAAEAEDSAFAVQMATIALAALATLFSPRLVEPAPNISLILRIRHPTTTRGRRAD